MFNPFRGAFTQLMRDFKWYRRRKGGKWFLVTHRPISIGAISAIWYPGEPSDWKFGPYDSIDRKEEYPTK